MYTNMRFKSLGLGRRKKDANSQTDIRQVTFAALPLFCQKTIQYYSKTIFAIIQYKIDTNCYSSSFSNL